MNAISTMLADKGFEKQIMARVPDAPHAQRFFRMLATAIYKTPKLLLCTPESVKISAYNLAELNLSPISAHGQAYLIPYEDRRNNKIDCQLQIGWRGLVTMAIRDGAARSISCNPVFKGEHFKCSLGTDRFIQHEIDYSIPIERNLSNLICMYAIAELNDGTKIFEIMSINQLLDHKKRYGKSDPWDKEPIEMMRKTVVKKLCKYIPAANEGNLMHAIEIDNEAIEMEPNTPAHQVENVTESIKNDLMLEKTPASEWLDAESIPLDNHINFSSLSPTQSVSISNGEPPIAAVVKIQDIYTETIDATVHKYILSINHTKTLPELDELYKIHFKALTKRPGLEQKHIKALNDAADLHKAKLQEQI